MNVCGFIAYGQALETLICVDLVVDRGLDKVCVDLARVLQNSPWTDSKPSTSSTVCFSRGVYVP